jgi:hypothetical protein
LLFREVGWCGLVIYRWNLNGLLMADEEAQSKRVSLAVNNNGRVTIPYRLRDYFDLPDTDENEVYLIAEIKGLDPVKHPDHEMKADAGGDIL